MLAKRGRGDQVVGLDKLPHSLSLVQCTTSRARGELAGATGVPAPPARHGGASQWLAGPWTEPSIDPCSRPRPACLPHPPTVRTRASSWQETSWQQSHPHRTRAIQVGSIEVSPEMDGRGEGDLILDKTLN